MSETTVIECPHCGATFKAKSKAALGKKVACPKCQTPFVISQSPSASRKTKPKLQKAPAKQDFENDLWEEDDEYEERPAPRERSGRPRGRAAGKPQPSGDSMKWIGLAVILVIVVGGIGLIALNTGSSSSKKPSENLAAKLMTEKQSDDAVAEKEESAAAEMEVARADTTEPAAAEEKPQAAIASTVPKEPVAPMADQGAAGNQSLTPAQAAESHLLVYQIVKLDDSIANSISKAGQNLESTYDHLSRSLARTVDLELQLAKIPSYLSGSTQIDLEKKLLSLQADPQIAKQVSDSINDNSEIKIQISETPEVVALELPEDEGDDLDYKVDFEIKGIDESISKQLVANPAAGASVLAQILNHHLSQSIPEYIPGTLKVDLESLKMTVHLTRYPESYLYSRINKIPSIPVNVAPIPNTIRELRTPDQIKPTQVTFKIQGFKRSRLIRLDVGKSYNHDRGRVYSGLLFALTKIISGYIPGSLDVNFVDETVTFQLDHEPGPSLSKRINDAFFNVTLLSDQPIKTGPPAPPFCTPGRPKQLVVLRVTETESFGRLLTSELNPDELKRELARAALRMNSHFKGHLSGYIPESIEVDPNQLLIAFQMDRTPPADLANMVNSLFFFSFKVADEIVAVHDVQYDPESSEKTLYFQFANRNEFGPRNDREYIRDKTDGVLAYRLDRYIPNSLQMDFDQGTFNIKIRIGGNEQSEIRMITESLGNNKIDATYVKTDPPQGKGNAHPRGIGIVAGAGAGMATGSSGKQAEGKHLKVTIQYGLYAGKQNVARSARTALDGFAWIDLKSIQIDEAKKEITFQTKGEMNLPALERLLKRQKFYQCVLNTEALPDPASTEK
ncbi:hypothetical protein Enr10x_49710 [Gimesia panareensis]|uniref:Zinc finger/thioredoxin putative domain-containing protein n=1 Tax=Gimesia panareensis TaxID=2527978 RepID=A0A517QDA6_9PLAN|nr:hypothetical protein [Gimesia panareensis]QDT29616.1 hypothetical protein Enr10x_49710 [Gimesia panareensis]